MRRPNSSSLSAGESNKTPDLTHYSKKSLNCAAATTMTHIYLNMRKKTYEFPQTEIIYVQQEHNFATYNKDNNQKPFEDGDVDF